MGYLDPPEETWAGWERAEGAFLSHWAVDDDQAYACGASRDPEAEAQDLNTAAPADACAACLNEVRRRDDAAAAADHAEYLASLASMFGKHARAVEILNALAAPGRGPGEGEYAHGYGEGWHDALKAIRRALEGDARHEARDIADAAQPTHEPTNAELIASDLAYDAARERSRRR